MFQTQQAGFTNFSNFWKTRVGRGSVMAPDFTAAWKTRLGKKSEDSMGNKRENALIRAFATQWKTRLG